MNFLIKEVFNEYSKKLNELYDKIQNEELKRYKKIAAKNRERKLYW